MAEFYIDADVTAELLKALTEQGHSGRHARYESNMSAAPDGRQLSFAASRGATLITHNRKDFLLLHDAWRRWTLEWQVNRRHEGILIVPQRTHVADLADAIDQQLRAASMVNELYEWVRGRGWRHHPFRRGS